MMVPDASIVCVRVYVQRGKQLKAFHNF